jgi:hypothetical protein
MSERGNQLLEIANRQISEVIDLLSASGEAALSLPNPGRQKLGDGTVGASALHTADSYHRIAAIVRDSRSTPREHSEAEYGHAKHSHPGHRNENYAAENVELHDLLDRLSAGSRALSILVDLTDEQLDGVPPAGSERFCDGKRTLEQVVSGALNHQSKNIDGLRAAIAVR